MDFLDPRRQHRHKIQLIIGYILVTIAVLLGVWLLFEITSGNWYDAKSGEIIQNGLLFVDSKPGAADIFLNGSDQNSKTSARFILPAGDYSLTLKKTGYRDWHRSFSLNAQGVSRYVYPFLLPVKPQTRILKAYVSQPPLMAQSPDRRWLLLQTPVTNSAITFDEFDANILDQPLKNQVPKVLTLPADVVSPSSDGSITLKVVEWSTDNKHVLLQHTFDGKNEFIIFNRDSPADSLNVNKLLNTQPTEVALRDKKISQLYIYSQPTATLELADTSKQTVAPLLKHVLAFKSDGPDLITYVTDQNAPTGQVSSRIWDGQKSYPLSVFVAGSHYLIDSADFQGHSYYVVGSDTDEQVNLYKDPLNSLKNPAIAKAVPILSLRIKAATWVAFSANTRFVAAEAGQEVSVYDLETQSPYHYSLKSPLDGPLQWMDGHRLIGSSKDSVLILDYDSTNQQELGPTVDPEGGLFDRNYNHLLRLTPAANNAVNLEDVDMRAGNDLPKSVTQ